MPVVIKAPLKNVLQQYSAYLIVKIKVSEKEVKKKGGRGVLEGGHSSGYPLF